MNGLADDFYHLHLISLLTLLLICTHVNHHQGRELFIKTLYGVARYSPPPFHMFLFIFAFHYTFVCPEFSLFPSLPICPGHFLQNLCQPFSRGIVLGSDILTNSYEHCLSKHIFITYTSQLKMPRGLKVKMVFDQMKLLREK